LLFSQGISGYKPLRRNRRQRLDELKTGDARPLPPHLKAQISRERRAGLPSLRMH
jgi:transposase